ncbi:MAG: hypothetical protein K0S39_3990 [Paenibacillus sp.]|nr:hypothetical protein [Paenibacillus sp.]
MDCRTLAFTFRPITDAACSVNRNGLPFAAVCDLRKICAGILMRKHFRFCSRSNKQRNLLITHPNN